MELKGPQMEPEEEGTWVAAAYPGPTGCPMGENEPVCVGQPCSGKGQVHPWVGGFKGVTDLVAAVGQTVALVAWVARVTLVALVA